MTRTVVRARTHRRYIAVAVVVGGHCHILPTALALALAIASATALATASATAKKVPPSVDHCLPLHKIHEN